MIRGTAMSKLKKNFKDKNVTKETKILIAETLIFPMVTHGSESWNTRIKNRKII